MFKYWVLFDELIAIFKVLKICLNKGLMKICLKLDALLLINLLNEENIRNDGIFLYFERNRTLTFLDGLQHSCSKRR